MLTVITIKDDETAEAGFFVTTSNSATSQEDMVNSASIPMIQAIMKFIGDHAASVIEDKKAAEIKVAAQKLLDERKEEIKARKQAANNKLKPNMDAPAPLPKDPTAQDADTVSNSTESLR